MKNVQTLQFEQHHRLALALERAGMDGPEMAAELGVHRNTITNYLKGHTHPPKAVIREWARITQAPFEWLMTGAVSDDLTHGDFEEWENQLTFPFPDQDFTNQLPRPGLSYLSVGKPKLDSLLPIS